MYWHCTAAQSCSKWRKIIKIAIDALQKKYFEENLIASKKFQLRETFHSIRIQDYFDFFKFHIFLHIDRSLCSLMVDRKLINLEFMILVPKARVLDSDEISRTWKRKRRDRGTDEREDGIDFNLQPDKCSPAESCFLLHVTLLGYKINWRAKYPCISRW